MDRIWIIPEEYHAQVGEYWHKEQWRNLVWVYNHFKVGRGRLCECEGSFAKVKTLFEPFKKYYEPEDN